MSRRAKKAIMVLVMTVIAMIALFPFYMMINMGTYKTNDLYTGIKLFIGNYAKENFHSLMQVNFLRYYWNSVFVSVSGALLTVLVCALCGYGLGKYKFRGQKTLTTIVMLTMMVPTQLASWNSFLVPVIIISRESLFTLPLGIRQLATQFRTDLGAQILGLTIATIPILILFGYFSDNLISGLAAAAVKE